MVAMISRRMVTRLFALLAAEGVLREPWASRAIASTPVRRIVFVHGRGQAGLDPAGLKAAWLQDLRIGIEATGAKLPDGLDIVFPYYGNKLEAFVAQSKLPLGDDLKAHGGPQAGEEDYISFRAELVQNLASQAGVTQPEIEAQFGDEPTAHGPQNWAWVIAIIRAIDARHTTLSSSAIEDFIRDVYLYTHYHQVQTAIDAIVREALTTEPCLVVAHSLGSVVAYNVLRNDPRSLVVPLFATIGSPLGIVAVEKKLTPLTFPGPVKAWYNAFDRHDIVALNPLDAAHFAVDPPIENYGAVKNFTENHHSVEGYLEDKFVAGRILAGFG
jgi:hypothetical protein